MRVIEVVGGCIWITDIFLITFVLLSSLSLVESPETTKIYNDKDGVKMYNFQNELQMLGLDDFAAGEVMVWDPQTQTYLIDDARQFGGRCGGRCGGFGRCGGQCFGRCFGHCFGHCFGRCFNCFSCFHCWGGGFGGTF
jgi:heterocycloanthracin/sonorensin family bacteriocin